jgi:hypothetical protein
VTPIVGSLVSPFDYHQGWKGHDLVGISKLVNGSSKGLILIKFLKHLIS